MYCELNHLLFLYPPVPRTHEYWGVHCPLQLLWWRRPCRSPRLQGLGTEPIRGIRDVEISRISEEYRPPEDPVTVSRTPVDLEERYDGDRRRHPETTIPKRST